MTPPHLSDQLRAMYRDCGCERELPANLKTIVDQLPPSGYAVLRETVQAHEDHMAGFPRMSREDAEKSLQEREKEFGSFAPLTLPLYVLQWCAEGFLRGEEGSSWKTRARSLAGLVMVPVAFGEGIYHHVSKHFFSEEQRIDRYLARHRREISAELRLGFSEDKAAVQRVLKGYC